MEGEDPVPGEAAITVEGEDPVAREAAITVEGEGLVAGDSVVGGDPGAVVRFDRPTCRSELESVSLKF